MGLCAIRVPTHSVSNLTRSIPPRLSRFGHNRAWGLHTPLLTRSARTGLPVQRAQIRVAPQLFGALVTADRCRRAARIVATIAAPCREFLAVNSHAQGCSSRSCGRNRAARREFSAERSSGLPGSVHNEIAGLEGFPRPAARGPQDTPALPWPIFQN